MRSVDFFGYTIQEDGTIFGLKGKKLKHREHNGRYEIKLNVEGVRMNFISSRLIYNAFKPFDISDSDLCVSFKDDNTLNISFDNLYLIKRKDLIQGEKHREISKLSDEEVIEIRLLYNGKSSANQYDKTGYSYNDLAKMYGVSKGNIMWIVRGMSRNESEYKL